MVYLGHRAKFGGELNKKTIKDLKMLDYNLTNANNRNKCVDEIIGAEGNCKDFYDEYIDSYYKYDTKNELAQDINVFKAIENMGTYLLNSKDLKKEKKQEYKIYTDEQLFKIALTENNCSKLLGSNDADIEEEQLLHYLMTNKRNEYYRKDFRIKKEDFEDERIADVLKDYNRLYEFVKNELNNIKNKKKSNLNLYQARNMIKSINDDMILAKQKIINPIEMSPSGDFSQKIDWEQFDFENKEHIKAILYIQKEQIVPDDDVSLIVYDVNNALKKLYNDKKIDKIDLTIIKLIRQEKSYTLQQIGKKLNMSQQAISKRIDKISEKIVKFFK